MPAGIQKTLIIADSLSSLQVMQQVYSDYPLVTRIEERIHSATEMIKKIRFICVLKHVGISGNECVERIAGETMDERAIIVQKEVLHFDFKNFVKTVVLNSWRAKWQTSRTKLKEIKDLITPWKTTPQTRQHQAILTGTLTNTL
ncbi:hypothetical protein HHI36_013408 [Cryptolaemus montrouzieri]|uniref:RNase H type-1 domain-containing protein n=1 Tax=Cryptolaemus montrouzieri TaxID=559131 RepID=A0ABD2NHH9_9CUCU